MGVELAQAAVLDWVGFAEAGIVLLARVQAEAVPRIVVTQYYFAGLFVG